MLAVVAVENSLRKNNDMEMRGWNDVLEKQWEGEEGQRLFLSLTRAVEAGRCTKRGNGVRSGRGLMATFPGWMNVPIG